ncbi:hypothetical protein FACS1894185_3150 [Betaproteobacteria bacterium]|nr:hypothetical protein FACS1894185_3150 [Betaproteobacteria bacterium]
MNNVERMVEQNRRQAILALLTFAAAQTMSARELRTELENVHGQVVTVDRVRSDLIWMADVGVVRVLQGGDAASITERGKEIVLGRAALPGGAA